MYIGSGIAFDGAGSWSYANECCNFLVWIIVHYLILIIV